MGERGHWRRAAGRLGGAAALPLFLGVLLGACSRLPQATPAALTPTAAARAVQTATARPDSAASATPEARPAVAYAGRQEETTCAALRGWAWDRMQPDQPVYVQIFDGTQLLATLRADEPRPDLRAAGVGVGAHGFTYALPASVRDGRPHVIRVQVYAIGAAIENTPQTITCAAPATPATPATPRPASPTAAPTPPPATATPVPTSGAGAYLVKEPDNVNLRGGPGTDYPVVGLLTPGTRLEATGETEEVGGERWGHFRLADGRDGWVRFVDLEPVSP
ncbi:MAG TPA: SH3 domain-containing protein [Thermomicrobiales bacterium]|nr:SH3 domain-containing protein [Thermomicrobiales bacterium]